MSPPSFKLFVNDWPLVCLLTCSTFEILNRTVAWLFRRMQTSVIKTASLLLHESSRLTEEVKKNCLHYQHNYNIVQFWVWMKCRLELLWKQQICNLLSNPRIKLRVPLHTGWAKVFIPESLWHRERVRMGRTAPAFSLLPHPLPLFVKNRSSMCLHAPPCVASY